MNSRFLDACRRRPTDVRPVWFMRQAGRYLRQYREMRSRHSILEIAKRPDLAAAATLQPVEILDVDAAIIFADLLLPVEPMANCATRRAKGRSSATLCARPRYRHTSTANTDESVM
jgi:uroporphyrinogen-III decarboxylase